MAQKNRANMLTDIVNNIYNNLINFITGQNAQDRFVNLLDSSPNILSDASQPNGYVSTDANNEMFSSYYDEEISRADLITDLTANLAVGGKFYRINDAVGSTITLLVIAESNINLYSIGTDIATGEQGTYDITTDVFIPIVVSGTPDLQQVTDVYNETTNKIVSSDGVANYTEISNGGIKILTGNTGNVVINASQATATYTAQLPDKPIGTETFAMMSDITGGVASVNSGTNISVDNTDPANPIINSLSDRYSTSSITSNSISNGAKTFTVDADLAYIPLQEVLIVNDPTHHMHATVTSYNNVTGALVVDVKSHTGSGTFIVWVLNLDGVPVDAITGVGTANEIAYFTSGQVIASLPVATYPSLTELAYVKGVGSQVVGTTDTNTLTNKRITARTGTTTSSATPTINTDNVDFYSITAQAVDITSFTTNLSGATTTEGQTLWIAITGTAARAITWGTSFEASTIALPTTTVTTARLDVAFIWNSVTSKWRCVGVA
jgi:hypothetical protein